LIAKNRLRAATCTNRIKLLRRRQPDHRRLARSLSHPTFQLLLRQLLNELVFHSQTRVALRVRKVLSIVRLKRGSQRRQLLRSWISDVHL